MQALRSAVLTALVVCCSFTSVLASLSNVTVDDTGSAIQYSPSALWNDGSNCAGCTATPDLTKTSGGTWHDSTHQPGSDQVAFASLQFTGTAVYVFCIVAHSFESPISTSDMVFFLDGQQVGTFSLAPNGSNVYDYNFPVYSNRSIPPGTHTITLQNGRPKGPQSLVLLDYIVYTTGQDDSSSSMSQTSSSSPTSSASPSSSTSTSSTRIIVAAVVPSVVALLIAAVAIFFCMRRRRPQGHYDPPDDLLVKGPEAGSWEQNSFLPVAFPTSSSAAELTTSGAMGRSESQLGLSPPPCRKLNSSTLAYSEDYQNHGSSSALSYSEAPAQAFPQPSPGVHASIATTSEPEVRHEPERQFASAPRSKAEEAGIVVLSPVGLRPLPAWPASGMQAGPAHIQRSPTSFSSDVPPAYDAVSRDNAARP